MCLIDAMLQCLGCLLNPFGQQIWDQVIYCALGLGNDG
jgi:hypothetical protein